MVCWEKLNSESFDLTCADRIWIVCFPFLCILSDKLNKMYSIHVVSRWLCFFISSICFLWLCKAYPLLHWVSMVDVLTTMMVERHKFSFWGLWKKLSSFQKERKRKKMCVLNVCIKSLIVAATCNRKYLYCKL